MDTDRAKDRGRDRERNEDEVRMGFWTEMRRGIELGIGIK